MQTLEFLELQMRNFSGYHFCFYFIYIVFCFILLYFIFFNIKGDFQICISVPLIDFINS